jgi:hypothetical protein
MPNQVVNVAADPCATVPLFLSKQLSIDSDPPATKHMTSYGRFLFHNAAIICTKTQHGKNAQ